MGAKGNGGQALSLSPSSIQLYLQNPREFYWRKILKKEDRPSYHLVYGSALHKAIDFFHKKKIDGQNITLKQLSAYFLTQMTKMSVELNKREKEKLMNMRDVGRLAIVSYFKAYENFDAPFKSEQKLSFFVDDVKIKNRVDAVYSYEDKLFGEKFLEIVDYKTAKTPYSAGQVLTSFQLRSYAYACEEIFKISVRKAKFVIITKDSLPKIYEQTLNFENLPEGKFWKQNFIDDIRTVIRAIKSDIYYRKYDNYLFDWDASSEENWGTRAAYEYILTKKII